MGGRGAASIQIKWGWENPNSKGPKIKWVDKDPIGPENKPMYKDTAKNVTSIFPILQVKDIEPLSIKGALGVASIGYENIIFNEDDTVTIQGKLKLGFDPNVFATQESLKEKVESNFEKKWNSTNLDNHIVVHEFAHMLDNQLTIKKHYNMSLEEWLSPRKLSKAEAFREVNSLQENFSDEKLFSAKIAEELQKEMKQSPEQLFNQISRYSRDSKPEFFAEAFTKWYLSKDRNGDFEKAFEKVLKREISKI